MILTIVISVIVTIIAFPFILALFIKKEYTIRKDIIINKPVDVVFDYIRYLRNQEQFSKWVMTDPKMKTEFRGTDGQVGFVYAWDSEVKQAGKGEQEIMALIDGKRMDVEVRFEKPMKGVARTPFILESVSASQTRVNWGMHGHSNYPMNVMNPFMDKLLGKDLQESLQNLKSILEK